MLASAGCDSRALLERCRKLKQRAKHQKARAASEIASFRNPRNLALNQMRNAPFGKVVALRAIRIKQPTLLEAFSVDPLFPPKVVLFRSSARGVAAGPVRLQPA